MKKTILNLSVVIILCISLFVLLMQGFGLPSIIPVLDLILRIVPLILTVAFALWGGWLFLTSDSWANATFGDYFADYCTPALGCAVAYIIYLVFLHAKTK